jgi:hypothetical protein
MKTNGILYSLLLGLLIFIFTGCEKRVISQSDSLAFPAGRSFLGSSDIKLFIDDEQIEPSFVYDSCGGYWIKLEKNGLEGKNKIRIEYTRREGGLSLFKEPTFDYQEWTSESYFIDCNNSQIVSKAVELTNGLQGSIAKALQIHQFVVEYLELRMYHDSFLDKASKTFELGYGTCMNFSRLFVALCRAAGIPSRSVWGVVYGYNNDSVYDYHHQWAEIRDEDGYWHQADFTYTVSFELNDIRYLDLLYAAEENEFVRNRNNQEIVLGDVSYFNDYPATLTGRLGFELVEDGRPEFMIVRYLCGLK